MNTELLFRADAYLRKAQARVIAADARGIQLDRTIFYPQGGGQPGDRGSIVRHDGTIVDIANTLHDDDRTAVLHQPAAHQPLPAVDEIVTLSIDWPLRHARMRVHTALHLLSVVLPYPVTGGSVGDGEGRLDFDWPEAACDKLDITSKLQEIVDRDVEVSDRWITDEELLANPGLVKTLSVKPPIGSGRVRLIEIAGLDLQPCGGTHVRRTGEIGQVAITAIEKKGRHNRRVRLALL